MGLLLCFLDGPCDGDANAHRLAMSKFSFEDRLHARQNALTAGYCEALFVVERAEHSGDEDGEPKQAP